MSLTRTGWPRPVVGGLPIPWVSPAENLAEMIPAREAACATGAICQVCGEGYGDDELAYVLVQADTHPDDMSAVDVQAMDNGVLHERCARVALALCPKLLGLISEGMLQVVKVRPHTATVHIDEGGRHHAMFVGAGCEPVALETLRSPK